MSKQSVQFFIDIDGCVMPDMFSRVFYKDETEKLIHIAAIYKNAVETDFQLFLEFIEFYKRITSNPNYDIEEITFVTGRQENCFGWLTEKQLKPLEKIHWFHIHYFYNFAKHTAEVYQNFKVHTILDTIQFNEFRGILRIYDDWDLSNEFEASLDIPFEFNLITNREDWNKL